MQTGLERFALKFSEVIKCALLSRADLNESRRDPEKEKGEDERGDDELAHKLDAPKAAHRNARVFLEVGKDAHILSASAREGCGNADVGYTCKLVADSSCEI